MSEEFKQLIRSHILDEATFVQATFAGQRRGEDLPWEQVTIRPVMIKGERHLQFAYFEPQRNISKNYLGEELAANLDELLAHPFKRYRVESGRGNFHVQITKKGKGIIHREKLASAKPSPPPQHDQAKNYLLAGPESHPFLQAMGIMRQDGQIRANMQRKMRQINEFLKLVDDTISLESLPERRPLHVVDFGCGNATLTFAIYHYLNHVRQLPARLTGVDLKQSLLEKRRATGQQLGWPGLDFVPAAIIDFASDQPADIVLALHACDTATDEALAKGIGWESRFIFSAPCCHHHLQQQLGREPAAMQAVMRHGILKERLGDILTDALRAAILRILGYKAEVVEFVSSEHTAKNLMIRAVKRGPAGRFEAVQAYIELKSVWQVTPYLETLLGERLQRHLSGSKK